MKVKLSDITNYSKGAQINGDELIENGEYIYLNGGINPSGRWSSSNVSGDTVTISEGGNSSGYVNYISEPFWCGAHCYYLYDGPSNSKYLYYALKSQQDRLFAIRSGACMPNIKKSDLGNFELEFDSDEQKQNEIVNILSNVEQVISSRQKELELFDELIKARFVEMFGDLEKNEKGWDERPLLDVCNQLKRYPTFCNMDYLEQGTRVIRIGNILLDGHMDVDDNNYVFVYDTVNEDFPDTVISINDIVMAVRGDGSAAKRIGIIQEEKLVGANISPNLIRIQANTRKVAPLFLFHYLISEVGQKRLDSYVNKTAKKNIAAKDIAKVKTPIPEIGLQNEYVDFVKQVDKSKFINVA